MVLTDSRSYNRFTYDDEDDADLGMTTSPNRYPNQYDQLFSDRYVPRSFYNDAIGLKTMHSRFLDSKNKRRQDSYWSPKLVNNPQDEMCKSF